MSFSSFKIVSFNFILLITLLNISISAIPLARKKLDNSFEPAEIIHFLTKRSNNEEIMPKLLQILLNENELMEMDSNEEMNGSKDREMFERFRKSKEKDNRSKPKCIIKLAVCIAPKKSSSS